LANLGIAGSHYASAIAQALQVEWSNNDIVFNRYGILHIDLSKDQSNLFQFMEHDRRQAVFINQIVLI